MTLLTLQLADRQSLRYQGRSIVLVNRVHVGEEVELLPHLELFGDAGNPRHDGKLRGRRRVGRVAAVQDGAFLGGGETG